MAKQGCFNLFNAYKRNNFDFLFYTFFFLFLIYSARLTAATPGVTLGEFSVGTDGSANYNIPIVVPPGTAGMQPSLSLSYNSRSGNGFLGVGWTLGGLSVITRCSKTTVIDGELEGIGFDDDDRFCIDGQRLIQVTGTAEEYGNDGIEYRTEVDGFTQVISYDTDATNSGPEYFIAKTKSGQILEYGNTAGSRIEAQGVSDVRLWAVNKISDTVGNHMVVNYYENAGGVYGSIYLPISIYYSANSNVQGEQYYVAAVTFKYANRYDVVTPLFQGGKKIRNVSYILDGIHTHTISETGDAILVKAYQFRYENSGAANRARLTQLNECDGADEDANCFAPLRFDWEQAGEGGLVKQAALSQFSRKKDSRYIASDFNGDGLTDIVALNTTTTLNWWNSKTDSWVGLSQGDGHFTKHTTLSNLPRHRESGYLTGDFNGDGLADIGAFNSRNYYSWIGLSSGDGGFTKLTTLSQFPRRSNSRYLTGDFNGDGLTDIGAFNPNTAYSWVGISQGDGRFTKVALSATDFPYRSGRYITGDFNGDGLTDISLFTLIGGNSWIGLSRGDGYFEKQAGRPLASLPVSILVRTTIHQGSETYIPKTAWDAPGLVSGDFNGDGITDMGSLPLRVGSTHGNYLWVGLSRGDGQVSRWRNIEEDEGEMLPDYTVGDFNGDGLADVIALASSEQDVTISLSKGDGRFDTMNLFDETDTTSSTTRHYLVGDFNGDGLSDLMSIDTATSRTWLGLSKQHTSRRIKRVTGSLGDHTTITYSTITDSPVYSKGSSATYPEVDIQSPIYVVSKVTVDDGLGGTRDTDYTYSEAKSSLDGRGFLGFKTMTVVNSSTGIKTKTTYSQTHPYIGLIERTEQRLSNDDIVGEVDTSFAQTQTHSGVGVESHHPGVLFPYASTVTKKNYELEQAP